MTIYKHLTLALVVFLLVGSCKKDDVVLDNPTKLSRSISLPITMYNIDFAPHFIFSEIESRDDVSITPDSVVHFLLTSPFDFDWTFDLNLDIKALIGNERRLDLVDNMFIYNDFINGLPFSVYNQIYALNGEGDIIESLLSNEQAQWKSPTIDVEGKVSEAVLNPVDIELSTKQITNMYKSEVKTLRFESRISSEELMNLPDIPETIMLPNSTILGAKMSIYINKPE